MKWRGRRQSTNVIDRRSSGGGAGGFRNPFGGMLGGGGGSSTGGGYLPRGGGGLGGMGGIGLIVVIVIIGAVWLFGGGNLFSGTTGTTPTDQPTGVAPTDDAGAFVATVLAETEDTWNALFAANGRQYQEPELVLFTGETSTGCGFATADVGPFYCPADRRIYIDLSFYNTLERGLNAGGDFAQAYVLAHEVGHHVQNLLGVFQQAAGPGVDANEQSVRTELQADCYAGVWGNRAQSLGLLDPGDIEEALNAATQIGDDNLQRRQQGYVQPETFTHGTSAQRARWFRLGFDRGDPSVCNTFAATTL